MLPLSVRPRFCTMAMKAKRERSKKLLFSTASTVQDLAIPTRKFQELDSLRKGAFPSSEEKPKWEESKLKTT